MQEFKKPDRPVSHLILQSETTAVRLIRHVTKVMRDRSLSAGVDFFETRFFLPLTWFSLLLGFITDVSLTSEF